MKVDQVTTRYATALFELARDSGALPAVQADMDAIAREIDSGALALLFDARVAHEDKQKRITALAAGRSVLSSNLLHVLFKKRRVDVVRGLPAAFRRCALADRGVVEGIVEAPRTLGQGELAEIAVAMKSLLGTDVLLEQRSNPELLAGVRVFVANRLIDQSALGRLEGLERRLKLARIN
jgi:F-type H+-transporting ATPase subunit delta